MKRQPIDHSNETISWGQVCTKVRYGDGLYQTCRDKLPSFTGFEGGMYDEEMEEDDFDIDKEIRKKALPIPAPPSAAKKSKKKVAEKESESLGLLDDIMHGDLGRYLLYGGSAAALVWWFLIRDQPQQVAISDSARTLPSPSLVNEPSIKAA